MATIDGKNADGSARRLYRLGDLDDFKVAENESDVRGWEVYDNEGNKLGKVTEMLVDTTQMKVRYLEVDLLSDEPRPVDQTGDENITDVDRKDSAGGNIYKEIGDMLPGSFETTMPFTDPADTYHQGNEPYTQNVSRHILIPVGIACIDQENDYVIVMELDKARLVNIPPYDGSEVTRDYENALRRTIGMDTMTIADPDNYYENNDYYNPDKFYGTRRPARHERRDDDIGWDTSPRSRDRD